MNRALRLVVAIALIIVVAWLIVAAFRFAAWLLNGLVGVAALVLIAALLYRFFRKPKSSSPYRRKPPLTVEREPSREQRRS